MTARGPRQSCVIFEADPLPPADRVGAIDQPCLDALYREQKPGLLRFLRRRASNDGAADLVQQVFLRLAGMGNARRAAIVDPAGYLKRSAANLAVDQARADKRLASALHVPMETIDLVAPDQIAALEARDVLQRLESAMQRLKPRTREIFLAHRIDGYTYIEIAARTGLSVKGVEKHMSRAIAFVDRVLDAQ